MRLNGKIAILACFPQWVTDFQDALIYHWDSSSPDNRKYPMCNHHSVVGDWVTLKAHEPQDIEILIGEGAGGIFAAMLCVEVQGVEYPKNPHYGGPCLPFFKTDEFSRDMVEAVYWKLHQGEATCYGGPIFNDFGTTPSTNIIESADDAPQLPPPPPPIVLGAPEIRTWTAADGKTFEARFKTRLDRLVSYNFV